MIHNLFATLWYVVSNCDHKFSSYKLLSHLPTLSDDSFKMYKFKDGYIKIPPIDLQDKLGNSSTLSNF